MQGQVLEQQRQQQQQQRRVGVADHAEDATGVARSGAQRARAVRSGAGGQGEAAAVEGVEEEAGGGGAQHQQHQQRRHAGAEGGREGRSCGETVSGQWRGNGERPPWEYSGGPGPQREAGGAGSTGEGEHASGAGGGVEEQDVDLTQEPHGEEDVGGMGQQEEEGEEERGQVRVQEGWRRERLGEQSGPGGEAERPGPGVGHVDERDEGEGQEGGRAAADPTQPRAVLRPGADVIRTGWAQGAGQGGAGRQDGGTGGEGWRPGLVERPYGESGGHGLEAGARGGRGGSRYVREPSPAVQDVEGAADGMGWPEEGAAGGGESQAGEGDGSARGVNAKWFSKRGRSRDPFEWSGDEAGAAARGGNGMGRPGTGVGSGRGAAGAGAGAGGGGSVGRRLQQQTLPFLPKPGRGAQQGPEAGAQGPEAGRRSGRRYAGQPWSSQQQPLLQQRVGLQVHVRTVCSVHGLGMPEICGSY